MKCNIELANLVEKLWRFAKYRLSLQLDNANVLNRIENDMQTLALVERYDVISRKNMVHPTFRVINSV